MTGDRDTPDEGSADCEWFHRPETLRYKLVDWASRRTCGRIRSPHYRSTVAYYGTRDEQKQAECRIEPDEHVQVHGFWAAEFYTPDTIGRLYAALSGLEARGASSFREPLDQWLRTTRHWPMSSHNLYFTPPGVRRFFDDGFKCPYPSFANHVGATLYCITPSLTMLVTFFRLSDPERDRLDDLLHRDHPTRITPHPGGSTSVSDPRLEQRRLVAEQRARWLDETTGWYRTHFPGLLTTASGRVPMCAFTTIEGPKPFARKPSRNPLLEALGYYHSHSLYEGSNGNDHDAFLLNYGDSFHGPEEMIHLVAEKGKFLALAADHYGGDTPQLSVLDSEFRRTFAAQALWHVLKFYTRRAGAARDDASAVIGRGRAVKALARLRTDSARCIDAATIARELLDILGDRWHGFHDMAFVERAESPRARRSPTGPHSLREVTRARFTADAKSLLANVQELNAGLNAQANLLSAHANLRLQPWIILLALVSMAAGIVAAVPSAKEFLATLPWP